MRVAATLGDPRTTARALNYEQSLGAAPKYRPLKLRHRSRIGHLRGLSWRSHVEAGSSETNVRAPAPLVPGKVRLAERTKEHDVLGVRYGALNLHAGRANRHPGDSQPFRLSHTQPALELVDLGYRLDLDWEASRLDVVSPYGRASSAWWILGDGYLRKELRLQAAGEEGIDNTGAVGHGRKLKGMSTMSMDLALTQTAMSGSISVSNRRIVGALDHRGRTSGGR